MREIILHRVIIIEITEIHHHNVTVTVGVQIEIIRNNITGEAIIGHIHHSVMEPNNTRPKVNSITDKMDKIDRVTVIEAVIGADGHVEGCSPTAGRLEMTKAVIELDKELQTKLLTQDLLKMNQEIVDVGHAPMKIHALRDCVGQPR